MSTDNLFVNSSTVQHDQEQPFTKSTSRPQLHVFPSVRIWVINCPLSDTCILYIDDDIQLVTETDRRQVRSAAARTCLVPQTHNNFGDRSFNATSPRAWNIIGVLNCPLFPFNGCLSVIDCREMLSTVASAARIRTHCSYYWCYKTNLYDFFSEF